MWPRDRGEREILRLGAMAAERWVGEGAQMRLADRHAMPHGDAPIPAPTTPNPFPPFLPALRALYPTAPKAPIHVVIESAWLPLLLADTGGHLWVRSQVEALVRHRFSLAYDALTGPEAEVRVDHRAGERYALGYALPTRLKQGLDEAAQAVGLRWHAWVPALVWGAQHLIGQSSGWWAWPEQDRLLLLGLDRGRPRSLNAAAPQVNSTAELERLVDAECVRCGVEAPAQAIRAFSWQPLLELPAGNARVSWTSRV